MIERDDEYFARLLRRLPRFGPARPRRDGCPEDELLGVYLESGLPEAGRSSLESHLASCRFCLDELSAAHAASGGLGKEIVPANALARAMALMAQAKPRVDVFKLVVELARDSLELISTSGRLVMPTLVAQIRGKEKTTDNSVLQIESELGKFQIEVDIERLEDDLCQVGVIVKDSGGSLAEGLRLSLMSGEREQASYLARQGAAVFDRIPPGDYQLVVAGSGNAIGVIQLSIKENGHERERKTD